jgi:hypothetical protein
VYVRDLFLGSYSIVALSLRFDLVIVFETWLHKHYATQHYVVLAWGLSTTHR